MTDPIEREDAEHGEPPDSTEDAPVTERPAPVHVTHRAGENDVLGGVQLAAPSPRLPDLLRRGGDL